MACKKPEAFVMWKKMALLFAAILLVTIIWFVGLQTLYARILVFPANVALNIGGSNASMSVEKEDGHYYFIVYTQVEEGTARLRQQFSTILYPTIMVLAWQVFIAFALGWQKSIASARWNLGIFFLSQVLFLLSVAFILATPGKFLYEMMLENFYIIALVIIIIDNIRNPVFYNTLADTP